MDWQREIDGSFGDGPPPVPVEQRLAAGRAALRRRRLATGTAGITTALVLGGIVWAGSGGTAPEATPVAGAPSADTSVASSSPAAPSPDPEEARKRRAQLVSEDMPVAFDIDGALVVKPGWRITQRVRNPLHAEAPYRSLGLEVVKGQQRKWGLVSLDPAYDGQGNVTPGAYSTGGSWDPAYKSYSRLEDWVADMAALQQTGDQQTQHLVTWRQDGSVLPAPGVTVLATRKNPPLGSYTGGGGLAVKVEQQGRTWFVVVRGNPGEADYLPVDAAILRAPTFAALYDHVRGQNASGEGLR